MKIDWPKVLKICTYFVVFLALLFPYSDYDWGWHLRYGQYFFQTGHILRDNILTYTLPNYLWANHSWSYDIIFYLLYSKFGFLGLIITGAIVSFIVFLIPTMVFGVDYFWLGILAFFYLKVSEVVLNSSLRSQTVGLIFISLFATLLVKSVKNEKLLYFVPPIMAIWVNAHGSFTFGFFILACLIATNILIKIIDRLRKTKTSDVLNLKKLIFVSFASFLLSFINPFGYRVYFEGIRHLLNPWLTYVSEWMRLSFACKDCNLSIYLVFIFLLTIIFAKRKKLSDIQFIPIVLFLAIQAYLHLRYVGLLMAVSIPILTYFLSQWKQKIGNNWAVMSGYAILLTSIAFYYIFLRIPSYNLLNYTFEDYCTNSSGCSVGLSEYLLKNPPNGKGFNFYDWGGFLEGRGINAKLFIDGRMHLWNDGKFIPFADYHKIYYEGDLELFRQYNFDWMIVSGGAPILQRLPILDPFLGSWKVEYRDSQSVYIVKQKI